MNKVYVKKKGKKGKTVPFHSDFFFFFEKFT